MPKSLPLINRIVFPVVIWIIGATLFYYCLHHPINHDSAWFMYAARGLLEGGALYRDYIDVNAPMAYLTLIPAAWLSSFLSNEAAFTINIFAYILVAYTLCLLIIRHMNLPRRRMEFLQTGLLIVMCFMPHYAFGQREHLLAVLMMPYALAAGFRAENRALPPALTIACGIAAGVAVSIKLPYAVVPAALEAAILLRQRSWKIGITYDVLALVGSTAIIYLVCFALYPVYWMEILPSAVALYGPYDNFGFLTDALLLQVPLFVIGFAAGEYRGRGPLIGMRWMVVAAVLGSFALFILQRKGWPHHALPILMFVGVLCLLNLADIKLKIARDRSTSLLRGAVISVILACAFYLSFVGGNVDPDMLSGVEAHIRDTDGSFYILSTGNYPAFPLALDRRYHWTSRYPQLIMLPGLAEAGIKGISSPYEPQFRAAVLEDIQRGHPATVFLYVPTDAGMPDNYDMLAWFRRDPAFDKEWGHYQWIGTTGPFAVFRRMAGR